MSDIAKIDKNFVVKTEIEKDDIAFYNAEEGNFRIYGVFREGEKFRRLPEAVAETVNKGVFRLHANTAGGRVRFITDSPYIAISAKMGNMCKMSHFAFTGAIGFDLYNGTDYVKTFVPPFGIQDGFESVIDLPSAEEREITINFPLYSEVKELYIGLSKTAFIKEPKSYKNDKPIVYYGSSITQGGCASRPGMSYQSIISRRFNCDFVNLGFSGNARAEDEIANYIAGLEMSLFVYDYDHNAPSTEHLKNTHERMFKIVREKNPDLPIIMMNRPKFFLSDEEKLRLAVIEKTYNNALSSGDKNVYMINNEELCELCRDQGTVDNSHPTDFGFASMANAIGDLFEKNNLA